MTPDEPPVRALEGGNSTRPSEGSSGEVPALSTQPLLGGRYRLREPVGQGGMAVVWRAHDTHLKRDVALKLLHEHVLPVDRERFGREIRTLARLQHPGVIGIYDLGEDAGRVYFTMELLTGGPISDLGPLEDTPESVEPFLEAAHEAAVALAHVHAQGMVHRDLTPKNILLGGDGRPRVMDFGLVYVSDATRDLTRTGYTLGTPQYMAPEQAKGLAVGPAADLYALGAVLYRTAAGRAPFEADNDQAILYQHVYEAPPPLESVNPAAPRELGEALAHLLEKKPEHRPKSAPLAVEAAAEGWRRVHAPGQYRGGRARAGAYPGGPLRPERLALAWETQLPGEVSWPAAVTGGRDLVAVGTRSGTLCLLELGSGARWADFKAEDEASAPATFDGDLVVYGAWDGAARALEWRTGAPRWSHKTRADLTAAPTRWGERWLLASRDGHLHALSEKGTLEWAYRAGAPLAASPAFWGGLAYLADEDGWLHALSPATGALAWKVRLGPVHATPAAARRPSSRSEGVLVVPTWAGEVHALRLGAGPPEDEPLWTYDLEGEAWASPALAGGRAYLASWTGQLRALDLETGDDRWSVALGGRITASPVVSKGVVYAASEAGDVVAVRADSGEVIWRDAAGGSVQGTPLLTDGSLIVPFLDGRVRCYR